MNDAAQTVKRQAFRTQVHSMLRHPRPYLCFLAALFLIELLYSVLFFSASTDRRTLEDRVLERYDYELSFHGLTQPEYAQLYNLCGSDPPEHEPWRPYKQIYYQKQTDGSYSAYVRLRGKDTPGAAAYFLQLYQPNSIAPTYSPLYDYHAEYLPSITAFTLISTLAVFAIALILLVGIYHMRLARDTFAYGIYMTTGATFRQLFGRAASELCIVAALALLPAMALGFGAVALIYRRVDVTASVSFWSFLSVIAATALTIVCAVGFPMKLLSRRSPISLLHAKDNTPHVCSPRRSAFLLRARFPRAYEWLSLWRTRRYFVRLLAYAVLLPVLFVCTLSLSDIQQQSQRATVRPDFTVTFTQKSTNDQALLQGTAELSATVAAIDGVALARPAPIRTSAVGLSKHILLPSSAILRTASTCLRQQPLDRADADSYTHATNELAFTALDTAALAALQQQYTDIEGDMQSILSNDHTIIVTESINNARPFSLSVGDKILITSTATAPQHLISGELELLKLQLAEGTFTYEEYTVGAVIHDSCAESELLIGINFGAYLSLTGQQPTRRTVEVILKEDADFKAWQSASDGVYAAAFEYYNCSVENHHVFFSRHIATLRNLGGRMSVLALGFAVMAVLICFYSQYVFYDKRQGEWALLRALGASRGQLWRTVALSSLTITAIATALTLTLSLIADRLLFRLFYEWLPAGGFVQAYAAQYRLPVASLAAALLITALCTALPPLLAYRRYRKAERQAASLRQLLM